MNPKLYLINGPLGAGKTTLLKEMLQAPEYSRARIIENEFASTSIDSDQLHDHQAEVATIAGVCICCSTGNELIEALTHLSKSSDPVIIEATGVANSLQLLEKLIVGDVFTQYDLAHGVFVLDGVEAVQRTATIMNSYRDELLAADTVLVSKLDLISQDEFEVLSDVLRAYGVEAITPVFDGICDLEAFTQLSKMLEYYKNHENEIVPHDTGTNYTILALDTPLSTEGIRQNWKQLFTLFGLERMKGDIIDETGAWWHVEATPSQCRITNGHVSVSQLVCIGREARTMASSDVYKVMNR